MITLGRRAFLARACGSLLAVPMLHSLQPRKAWSKPVQRSVNYVQWVTNHGVYPERFWPKAELSKPNSDGIREANLKSVEGNLSDVLSDDFATLKDNILVCNGLDLLVGKNFHNACVPTCGSWPREDNHIPAFAHSVDSVLEKSSKVYSETTRLGALRLSPGVSWNYKWGSFSWTTTNGMPVKLPCYSSSTAAFATTFGAQLQHDAPGAQPWRVLLVDSVVDDYRTLMAKSALAAADRQRMDQYMELLLELQTRLNVEGTSTCGFSELQVERDFDDLHRNATDLTVAALVCGATKVIAYHCYHGSPSAYDEETFHSWAHNDAALHVNLQRYRYSKLAMLLSQLEQTQDGQGVTLLDRTLVYAGNELSEPRHASNHLKGVPVVLAGAGIDGGRYVHFGGRLLNNLFVTIFSKFGLSHQDYEREGVTGFGDYEGANTELYNRYLSASAKRRPLPTI